MRKLISLLLLSTTVLAQETIRNDRLKLGRPTATDKVIEFDKGAGAGNPKIKWNESAGALELAEDGTTFKKLTNDLNVVSTSTTPYTMVVTEDVILMDASGGAKTVNLFTAVGSGGKVIEIFKTDTSVNAVTIDGNDAETISGELTEVLRVPNSSVKLLSDNANWVIISRSGGLPWKVLATISGANPSLGTGDLSSYGGITNGSLTLTNIAGYGNLTAQIACSSTNPPTGTTCSAGDEGVGLAFTLPRAGDVVACVSFSWNAVTGASAGNYVEATFQVVETPTNAQTISQEGGARVSNVILTPTAGAHRAARANRVCGNFTFSTSGQKMLRLMFEQLSAGTTASSVLFADGDTSVGQRNIKWEVYPVNY